MRTQTTPAGQFTGRHMLATMLAFFGVVIAVNVGMAVVSSRSWTGLVVDNSYVASQQFEAKRLAHVAQVEAGWVVSFIYSQGVARLVVVDGAGSAVDLGEVSLKINRPVGGHDDRVLTMSWGAGGYSSAIALDPGVWQGRLVAARSPLGWFERHERFTVEGATP
jgi:nitrogen fixation protein FixH